MSTKEIALLKEIKVWAEENKPVINVGDDMAKHNTGCNFAMNDLIQFIDKKIEEL